MFDGTLGTKMRSECTFLIASTDALFEKKTHQYLRQLKTGNFSSMHIQEKRTFKISNLLPKFEFTVFNFSQSTYQFCLHFLN